MAELRPEEQWAHDVMTRALGTAVIQHDDGSHDGMHDLDIVGDGRREAVEVTSAADGEAITLWNLINGSDERWIEPDLVGGWTVSLRPTAHAPNASASSFRPSSEI